MDIYSVVRIFLILAMLFGAGLALFWIIRIAVARGMRDHYNWVARNHPTSGLAD
ncbi:hypothetical protein QMG61_01380 [Cryobacterium sp. PH31-AA6]|uniref:hypothetical protein n=1 Tax=Cryobacterium sp. PH31-AA6 TaxID=3046205 RepID=UPI0024BBD0A9|nr:hypothetical protein [Cryobacterium sp. PH31-AA6]MDJ0322416.1 hypothetical protein [Cryobacterium sp. PH31-AA6]